MHFTLVLALAGCAKPQADSDPSPPASRIPLLAVVTWNMDAGRGDLRGLVDDLATGRLTGTPAPEYVLLLQEAVAGNAQDVPGLARERGLSTFFQPVRRSSERTSGNAIVATRQLVNARAVDLPRQRQPRAAVVASIEVGGERLFLVSAHLENRIGWLRGGLFSDTARGRQADALLRALPADAHGILGGDLNTWLGAGEPAWRAFEERFHDTPDAPLTPTFRERLVLDHLFFDLPEGWEAARRVIPNRYGSDHHPVLGEVFHLPVNVSSRGGAR